LNLQEEKKG